MTRTVDLRPGDLSILRAVLRDHLSPDTAVWAFGSRVTGAARRYSDLDLALQGNAPLEWDRLARLNDALSESGVTIKVDVVDLRTVDPAFRLLIEGAMIRLPLD